MNYPTAILINHDNDYRAAYEVLAKAYLALEGQHHAEIDSRFIQISRFDDNPYVVHKVTADQISRAVDMADCLPEMERRWLYLDDVGDLQPVTIGERVRTGSDFYYADSPIMAAGCCVGHVVHTDH